MGAPHYDRGSAFPFRTRWARPAVIRDLLLAAVHHALDACGFPVPPAGVDLVPPKDSANGDFTTNVAMQLTKTVGMAPRDIAAKLVTELERERPAGPRAGRDRRPRLPEPLPLAHLAARRAAGRRRRGEGYGHGRTARRCAHQPRVRLGQPDGPAPRGRWRAGWPWATRSRTCSPPQGADVHREYYLNDAGNQLDTFAASLIARYRGTKPARGRVPGPVPRRHGRPDARPSWATPSPSSRPATGATGERRARLAGRPRPHRCALRHLVLRADAARSRRGGAGARRPACPRCGRRAGRRDVAAHDRLRRPARPRAGEDATARPPICATTSPTTATSSSAGGSTSSTSGAPTTTAR